ncbi:heparinase II/III family protein [Methylocystis sp. JR02]|uniref:heparinase II/III family protein n=1 Tax=Methylocystis sp. JR02 TaxID=3046284 RepID=UPI0024B8FD6C|nr:heparinase II/III family protein [Methylocystis sp. JR02]MDJ0450073.1 heparinase II/III family protein [Methylocystis sp. JR02]
MRLAGVLAAANAVARTAATPFHIVKSMAIAPPERLRIAPPDIRTADPTVADEIYAGYFSFAGKTLQSYGESPFALMPPSPAWRRALAGFSWLRHLRAADKTLAQENARALVGEFLAIKKLSPDDPALEPAVAARRLLSFLAQSPVLLEGAEAEFYDAFMLSLAQSARLLWRALATGQAQGADRALCAIALAEFAVCADTGRKIAPQVSHALSAELERQILGDGGHISRNPQVAVDLLLDLLPLRQVLAARGLQTPPAMLRAIDRMMPTLRMLQHGDGSLALFNGMGATELDRVASVLANEDTRGAAPLKAPYAGYQRLEAADAVVLVDAGAAPPPEFSLAAHAGCLSFEYSLGTERVVVNCGASSAPHEDLRDLARATAAHSTLVVDDRSSARIASKDSGRWRAGRLFDGPRNVTVERTDAQAATALSLTHDGYAKSFGFIHERELILSADGATLAGRDRLLGVEAGAAGPGEQEFAIRFHLHPRVRAVELSEAIELQLASGETLIFESDGAFPAIEESIFFASPGGVRKCAQIVLRGKAAPGAEVSWSFQRA